MKTTTQNTQFLSLLTLVKARLSQGLTVKEAKKITGGDITGANSKMPSYTFGISAFWCNVGGNLSKIAGSICFFCYCKDKGNYLYPSVKMGLERRARAVPTSLDIFAPEWVDYTAALVVLVRRAPKMVGGGPEFRWFDSGDLQSINHLVSIATIAELTPSMTHWLPTKEKGVLIRFSRAFVVPSNLMIRLSSPMIDKKITMPKALEGIAGIGLSHVLKSPPAEEIGKSVCPAYTQGGACLDCRNCWDRSIPAVSYPLH